jgi:HK97 family phage portal protein
MFVTKLQASAGPVDRGPGADFWFMPLGQRAASGAHVTHKDAMALSIVYACVKVLAESFAVMPFQLFRNDGNGRTRKMDRNHWLYRLFARRPNRWQNPFEWRLMLQGHLALRGNAYCEIISNARGEITELIPLHPDRMVIEMVGSGNDYRYVYTDRNGTRHFFARGDIWHLRGLSDDGIVGISPIQAARESVGEGLAMQSYSARFFGNDARPPGWIENPGKWKDLDTKMRWRESWQRMQGGPNRGKVAVLESGMKYHELGLKNTDIQFLEGRKNKAVEIARMFRMPLHKIQEMDRATNNNIEHQSIEFWTDTMLPYNEAWEASIEYQLLGQGLPGADDALEPEFDMDRMMRGDAASRAAYYASRIQWGTMTLNEPREREGEEPLPWLDHTMRPVNMIRVDASGEHLHTQAAGRDGAGQAGAAQASTRRENVAAMGAAKAARWRAVMTSNAQRMARRLAAGQATAPDLLAEALAIQPEQAAAWLAEAPPGLAEEAYAASLLDLAMKEPDQ